MRYQEIQYPPFGRCLEVQHGYSHMILSLDFGPRVLAFTGPDRINVLFEDRNDIVTEQGEFYDNAYGKGTTWHIYGGHRLWSSPQDMYSYVPDNHPIQYEVSGETITLTPPPQDVTGLQFELKVQCFDNVHVKIHHTITNIGPTTKRLAPWALTVFKGEGLEIVPLPKDPCGLAPQRYISLWDFGAKANDSRQYFGDRYFTLTQDPSQYLPLKIGLRVVDGYAMYVWQELVFVKRFTHNDNVTYPDNNVNFETYEDHRFIEMETLGEFGDVPPGASVSLEEEWFLLNNHKGIPSATNEDELNNFTRELLNRIGGPR